MEPGVWVVQSFGLVVAPPVLARNGRRESCAPPAESSRNIRHCSYDGYQHHTTSSYCNSTNHWIGIRSGKQPSEPAAAETGNCLISTTSSTSSTSNTRAERPTNYDGLTGGTALAVPPVSSSLRLPMRHDSRYHGATLGHRTHRQFAMQFSDSFRKGRQAITTDR
jgi:hypothetical protein